MVFRSLFKAGATPPVLSVFRKGLWVSPFTLRELCAAKQRKGDFFSKSENTNLLLSGVWGRTEGRDLHPIVLRNWSQCKIEQLSNARRERSLSPYVGVFGFGCVEGFLIRGCGFPGDLYGGAFVKYLYPSCGQLVSFLLPVDDIVQVCGHLLRMMGFFRAS
jgi:hypothetical protein